MKVANLLEKTPEIKKEIYYCQAMDEQWCNCTEKELCQRVIALETGLSDVAIKKMFDFFELVPEKSPFEIRRINGPKNKPRKFIQLKENYVEIIFKNWGE